MAKAQQHIYRLVVTANGGDDVRDLIVPDGEELPYDIEPETGARVYAQFWPPHPGVYRRFLSATGAKNRADQLRLNGCSVRVERSKPVEWEEV